LRLDLEEIIRKFRIQNLKALLAGQRFMCEALEKEFETEALTRDQKAAIARLWDDARKESHGLQLAIDLLEKRDKGVESASLRHLL
jgi:hypothetical protein